MFASVHFDVIFKSNVSVSWIYKNFTLFYATFIFLVKENNDTHFQILLYFFFKNIKVILELFLSAFLII